MNENISSICLDAAGGYCKHEDCNGKFYKKETFKKTKFECKCSCHRQKRFRS